jgi:lysophospholipase L1-like esterase
MTLGRLATIKKIRLNRCPTTAMLTLAAIFLLIGFGTGCDSSEAPAEDSVRAMRQPGPLRILPLGDSITHSKADHLSYRYYLWTKLIDTGVDFDFIGLMNSNVNGNPTWPDYRGRSFDRNHEGHAGWTVDQALRALNGGMLSAWLKKNPPDIVLLHLGTNDTGRGQSAESTSDELEQIIQKLRAISPNVTVMLAKLIPTVSPEYNERINELNVRIDGIAAEMSTASSAVIAVDHNSDFDATTDTRDGVHPNHVGEKKMAAKWFEALRPIVAKMARRRT